MVSGERCRSAAASASARSTQATPSACAMSPNSSTGMSTLPNTATRALRDGGSLPCPAGIASVSIARTGERLGQPGTSAPQLDLVRLDQRRPTELRIAARDQVRELACAGPDVDEVIALAEGRQGQQKLAIVFGLALGAR